MTKGVSSGKRGFYGWYALAGAMLTTMVGIGCFVIAFGVFLPVICEDFGWSRTAVAAGLTVGMLCNGLPSPLWGTLITRFGPRAMLITGSILMTLGLAGMSQIQQPWHIYVCCSLAGFGTGMCGLVCTSTIANNWFTRKRSLGMGMIIAAGCTGGFVSPPLITALISSLGWRPAWLVLAATALVLSGGVSGIILVRNRPEDMGQLPDGEAPGSFEEATITPEPEQRSGSLSQQVLRQPATWLIAVFATAFALPMGMVNTHQVAFVQDLGYSPMIAATTMSLLAGLAIFGSLAFGTLAMKFNIRYLASGCFALQIISLIIPLLTHNLVFIYAYVVIFGVGNGALISSTPTFVGAYYGRANYSRAMGILGIFQVIPQAGSATLAGAIYDATGNYATAFLLITIFSVVGLVCAFLAKPPRPQTA